MRRYCFSLLLLAAPSFAAEPWADPDPPAPSAPSERHAIGDDYGVRARAEYRVQTTRITPLALASENDPNLSTVDQRLRVDATLDFRDRLRLTTSIDSLDGVIWGDNGAFGTTPEPDSGGNINSRNVNFARICFKPKPGGNTVPAVSEVMRSNPDGYTMLMDGPPQSSMLETVVKNLPFKTNDRTFVAITAYTPMKFVVPYESPFQTLKEAADAVKQDPGTFTWTSLGGAGAQDMAFRLFFKANNVDIRKTRGIQLKGGSEAITMTAGGHVRLGVGSYSSIAAPLDAKRIRVLAVASPERWPNLPNTPTTAEAGFPSVEVLYWIGVSGPPKLPPHIVKVWDETLSEIAKSKAYADGLLKVGLLPLYRDAKGMAERIERESTDTKSLFAQ